ncbi:hypothetical protein X975_22985, partial [Stegodyphus mimosarum]
MVHSVDTANNKQISILSVMVRGRQIRDLVVFASLRMATAPTSVTALVVMATFFSLTAFSETAHTRIREQKNRRREKCGKELIRRTWISGHLRLNWWWLTSQGWVELSSVSPFARTVSAYLLRQRARSSLQL